jgi:hypothetical protein
MLGGVLEMQHLVKEDVLDGEGGDFGAVEDSAQNDRVVGWIEVSEESA